VKYLVDCFAPLLHLPHIVLLTYLYNLIFLLLVKGWQLKYTD
jgi:hypothetical protein